MNSDNKWSIIGHKNIIKYLKKSLKVNKLSHSYIFAGSTNLGKSLTANYFIKSILCKEKILCNKCRACRDFTKGIYPDFYNIKPEEDKKNISIEQIRKIINQIKESSFSGNFKIILIEEAEKMSSASFNSLLKSLEEPQKKTIFILITNKIGLFPKTILSRSQIINFHSVNSDLILRHLLFLGVNKERAIEIAGFSAGRPGLAIKYTENKKIVDDYKILVNNFLYLLNSPINEKLNYIDKIMSQETFKKKVKIAEKIIDNWLLVLRDIFLVKNFCFSNISHFFLLNRIKVISNNYSNQKIIEMIDLFNMAKINLQKNINPQLIIENLTLNF